MRWWRYGIILLIGALIGHALSLLVDANNARDRLRFSAEPQDAPSVRKRISAADTGMGAGIDGQVRSELGLSEDNFSFKAATKKLHDQPLSPQRTRAMLAYGIQSRDGKQLMEDFMNWEIGSEQLDAVVRKLTTEDPDGMWRITSEARSPVKTFDDLMTVNNALIQTLTINDTPGMIDRLNKLEPSRDRIFVTDTFSSFWAKQDPAAAAMGFDQILQLNPSGNAFAEQIVKSWNSKDPAAMATYIDQLPAGSTRQMFEKALGKLPKK